MNTSTKRTKSKLGYSEFPLKLSLPQAPNGVESRADQALERGMKSGAVSGCGWFIRPNRFNYRRNN